MKVEKLWLTEGVWSYNCVLVWAKVNETPNPGSVRKVRCVVQVPSFLTRVAEVIVVVLTFFILLVDVWKVTLHQSNNLDAIVLPLGISNWQIFSFSLKMWTSFAVVSTILCSYFCQCSCGWVRWGEARWEEMRWGEEQHKWSVSASVLG